MDQRQHTFSLREALVDYLDGKGNESGFEAIDFELRSVSPLLLYRENYLWNFPSMVSRIEEDTEFGFIANLFTAGNMSVVFRMSEWSFLTVTQPSGTIVADIDFNELSVITNPKNFARENNDMNYKFITDDIDVVLALRRKEAEEAEKLAGKVSSNLVFTIAKKRDVRSSDSSAIKSHTPHKNSFDGFNDSFRQVSRNSPHPFCDDELGLRGAITDKSSFGKVTPSAIHGPHPEIVIEDESFIQHSSKGKLSRTEHESPQRDPNPFNFTGLTFKGSPSHSNNQRPKGTIEEEKGPLDPNLRYIDNKNTPVASCNLNTQNSIPPFKKSKLTTETTTTEPPLRLIQNDSFISRPIPDNDFSRVYSFSQNENKTATIADPKSKKTAEINPRTDSTVEEDLEPTDEDYLTFPELMSAIQHGYIKWEDLRFREDIVQLALEKLKQKANRCPGR
jgi:hypothetical protein